MLFGENSTHVRGTGLIRCRILIMLGNERLHKVN